MAPATDPVLESRLLHEQRWPELTVQLFDEPAHLAPVQLVPPRHLRLLLLSGTMRMHLSSHGRTLAHLARAGMAKLTTPHHPAYEMHWTALTAAPCAWGTSTCRLRCFPVRPRPPVSTLTVWN